MQPQHAATAGAGGLTLPALPSLPLPPPPSTAPPRPSTTSDGQTVEPTPPPTPRAGDAGSARALRSAYEMPAAPVGRAAMGRAIRQTVTTQRLSKKGLDAHTLSPAQMLSQMSELLPAPVIRSERGSDAQVAPEEQFRLGLEARQAATGASLNAAGLPLPKFETPPEKAMPPLQADVPAGQRSQVEQAVLERTKQLNRLFEDQTRKQYEAMRREVRAASPPRRLAASPPRRPPRPRRAMPILCAVPPLRTPSRGRRDACSLGGAALRALVSRAGRQARQGAPAGRRQPRRALQEQDGRAGESLQAAGGGGGARAPPGERRTARAVASRQRARLLPKICDVVPSCAVVCRRVPSCAISCATSCASQERVRQIEQDNADLQQEVRRLCELMAEQEKRNNEAQEVRAAVHTAIRAAVHTAIRAAVRTARPRRRPRRRPYRRSHVRTAVRAAFRAAQSRPLPFRSPSVGRHPRRRPSRAACVLLLCAGARLRSPAWCDG